MDPHSYQEITHQSWLSRLGGAIKGVLVGFVLLVVAFPLLFWNEGRAVRRHRALLEGASVVASVPAQLVEAANDGRLVHVSGTATTDETLADNDFAVAARALQLRRRVEMYQWRESSHSEERDKLGGGTETVTTYEYELVWDDRPIDSSEFKRPEGHRNPSSMPISSRRFAAATVTLGGFRLSPGQVDRVGGSTPLPIAADAAVPAVLGDRGRVLDGGFYVGDPARAQVGDLRIAFSIVPPGPASVIARQTGDSLTPYETESGGSIELVAGGVHTAAAMFESAQSANTTLTWILRAVGCLVMFLGLTMILRPIAVTADVIPILGNIVEAGIGFVAFLLAATLSLVTIAIAWLVFRPLIGAALLAIAALLAFALLRRGRQSRPAAA